MMWDDKVSIKACLDVLPTSGDSWEMTCALCIAAKIKRAGTSSYGVVQRKDGRGSVGLLSLSLLSLPLALNPTFFLFSVCAALCAVGGIWTFHDSRMNSMQ